MYFFGGIEAVKQFQYISVKLTDIGYFHVEPHTFTSKNLIGTDFHSPANKDGKLFQAFGRTVQIQITVIPPIHSSSLCPLIVSKMVGTVKANASL